MQHAADDPRPDGRAEPLQGLQGRHILVTGASRGIGRAIAARLAGAGATLTLLARDPERLSATAAELSAAAGTKVHPIPLDLTDGPAIGPAVAEAEARCGSLAGLVNNAGTGKSSPFLRMTDAHWQEMLAVNLTSAFALTRAVLPGMLERGDGRIVNVASTAGLTGYSYVAAYCAAKHGLVGLTRALAVEVARKGVTVNAVCPGYTATDMLDATLDNIVGKTGRSREEALKTLVADNPQGRPVAPEEVAEAVAFLLSPAAAAVNGVCLPVDGGEVLK